jgi:hypothetical protein
MLTEVMIRPLAFNATLSIAGSVVAVTITPALVPGANPGQMTSAKTSGHHNPRRGNFNLQGNVPLEVEWKDSLPITTYL